MAAASNGRQGPGGLVFRQGDPIEVFMRMPFGQDNGNENLNVQGDRWLLCPTPALGTNRPRIGWTERWLPATVIDGPPPGSGANGSVRFRWDVHLWYDWASGECIDLSDQTTLIDVAQVGRVRPRSRRWNLPRQPSVTFPPRGTELNIGGVQVSTTFIVFRWGAAKIPIQYDAHSWGRTEGSTVSAKFMQLLINRSVVPRFGWDYEVLTVFIQHSDEFAGLSPEFLVSLCRGKHICALYFLWPIQGQMTYGDKLACTAAYVDANPFFEMVNRMELGGVVTRWPHHSQLWRSLASKDWVPHMCCTPKFHVPLTTRVPKSLVLLNANKAAQQALAAIRHLQADRAADDSYVGPRNSDWASGSGNERCVAKLGYSYEGVDVKMVTGEQDLAEALYTLVNQPGYTNDCVYVQQRVHRVDLEARCFVVRGEIVGSLYTRFARIDGGGYVRDYEKAHTAEDAMHDWFSSDVAAWGHAMGQIQALTRRWWLWMLTQSADPMVSVRIDYMMERVQPGKADVWTGEVGEQGYSMGGVDPTIVFDAMLDSISDEIRQMAAPQEAPRERSKDRDRSGHREAGHGNGKRPHAGDGAWDG